MPGILFIRLVQVHSAGQAPEWETTAADPAAVRTATEAPLPERLTDPKALERIADPEFLQGRSGSPWEGPRLRFTLLLGESGPWPLPPDAATAWPSPIPRFSRCRCRPSSKRPVV